MNPSANLSPACTYHQLENGIHVLTIRSLARAATIEYYEQFEHILEGQTKDSPTLRWLTDSTIGLGPIGFGFSQTRNLVNRLKELPPMRSAWLVSSDNFSLNLVESFVRMLRVPRIKFRTFTVDQYDQSIAWLLADE